MSTKIAIYWDDGKRSRYNCLAQEQGLRRHGLRPEMLNANNYVGKIEADIAIFYGLKRNLRTIFHDYVEAGKKAILIDLGYWNRTEGGKLEGYHKICVNSYHPTEYLNDYKCDSARASKLDISIKPFSKRGDHILLAGMSKKSSWAYHMKNLDYEKWVIKEIKKHTDRKIIFRAKPTCLFSEPIPGSIYSNPLENLDKVLKDAWAVVTHHSNVAIDGILKGIPAFVTGDGVASKIGLKDISKIEAPYYPEQEEIEQWINNLSYMQWRPCEIRSGDAWDWYTQRGFI